MMTAKIFENGRSQAVRLPKECRFNLTKQLLTNWILESVWKARKNSKIESTDTVAIGLDYKSDGLYVDSYEEFQT